MVAQASRVDAGRHKVMSQGVHHRDRAYLSGVTVVISHYTLGQRRAGGWLYCDRPHVSFALQFIHQEREADSREVAATAAAADNDIGVFVDHFQLFLGFLANDRLMHADVIQDAAQRVVGVVPLGRFFYRLGDGYAQAAGRVRVPCQHLASTFGHVAGGWRKPPPRILP